MEFLLYILTAFLIACGLLHVTWKLWMARLPITGSLPILPWIGSAFHLEKEPNKLFQQMMSLLETNDYIFPIWFSYEPLIVSGRVETAEVVLSSQENLTKSSFYWLIHEWLGTGLLTSKADKWKKRRRQITPTFHFSILNSFTDIFVENSLSFTNYLKTLADTNESFDIQLPISLATLDVICETSMGVKVHALKSAHSPYVEAISSLNGYIQERQKSPWLWPKFLFSLTSSGREFYKNLNIVRSFTTKVINDRIQSRIESSSNLSKDSTKKKVFIDMLLDLYDQGEIDVEGIREEVDTFMFEGHDTTAAGIGWTLYLLGKHPDVQKKLQKEIDEVSNLDCSLLDKIRALKYLDYVIKEGLRLHPPVAFYARKLEKDTHMNGHLVSKGTNVGISAIGLHTNPEYWDNPLTFNPDRFGDEKFLKRNPYIYVPFSAGPRNCVGQKFAMIEQKILLFHVMSAFRIESTQEEDEIEACFEIIHRSNNGLHIKLFTR